MLEACYVWRRSVLGKSIHQNMQVPKTSLGVHDTVSEIRWACHNFSVKTKRLPDTLSICAPENDRTQRAPGSVGRQAGLSSC